MELLGLYAGPQRTETHPNPEGKNPRRVREMIQNALNLINGVAFGSHGPRKPDRLALGRSPGPGQYETNRSCSQRKRQAQKSWDEGQFAGLLQQGSLSRGCSKMRMMEGPGPGAYFRQGNSLIKHSYNVTLPGNMICKRKEEIIRDRLGTDLEVELLDPLVQT